MPARKKILILTPTSIEKARKELAKLNESYSYLAHLCEDKHGILEVDFMEIGITFWLMRGKRTLDEIVQLIGSGITYYESLSEDEQRLDPPLRPTQPDPSLDQVFCDPPKTTTSYCPPDGPHPYITMMYGQDELETDLPLFILMDANRREEAIKVLPKLKAHTWSKDEFNQPLAEALSAIGLYLEITEAAEFTWFVQGLESSILHVGASPPEGYHLETCHSSAPTSNKIDKLKREMVPQAQKLKEQIGREAAYMSSRFYERQFVFTLGDTKIALRHQWDVDAVITLLDQAISNAARPTFVERVREFFQ